MSMKLNELLREMYLKQARMQEGRMPDGGCCGGVVIGGKKPRGAPKSEARQKAGAKSEYAKFVKEFARKHKGQYASGQELMKMAGAQWRAMKAGKGGIVIGGKAKPKKKVAPKPKADPKKKRAPKPKAEPKKKVAPRKRKGAGLVSAAQIKKWLE